MKALGDTRESVITRIIIGRYIVKYAVVSTGRAPFILTGKPAALCQYRAGEIIDATFGGLSGLALNFEAGQSLSIFCSLAEDEPPRERLVRPGSYL